MKKNQYVCIDLTTETFSMPFLVLLVLALLKHSKAEQPRDSPKAQSREQQKAATLRREGSAILPSQNSVAGKGPLRSSRSHRLSEAEHLPLDQAAQCPIQPSSEHCQEWGIHNPSVPVSAPFFRRNLYHPHSAPAFHRRPSFRLRSKGGRTGELGRSHGERRTAPTGVTAPKPRSQGADPRRAADPQPRGDAFSLPPSLSRLQA